MRGGKEGIISEPDEEALDPLVTDANTADLLWNNKTDDFAPDFAPISESVRKKDPGSERCGSGQNRVCRGSLYERSDFGKRVESFF